MKRVFGTILLLFFFSISLTAQKTISAKVVDAVSGQPLPGASVRTNTKSGLVSDAKGNISIDCNNIKSISISYVGYESATVFIKNCDEEIVISLQPTNLYLREVEVSATSSQNKSLLYQPQSISKIGGAELKRGTGIFLDEAINTNVAGVTMNRRTIGGGLQFNIRGYGNGVRGANGSSSNFDGQGYKVYLNGIPVTDAEGITVMDDIDFGSIGNVEVTKGPSGTLYGLAIAGAVNLRTVQPANGVTSVSQDVMIGNYGLQRYTTQFQMGREKSSLLVNYGHQLSDGITFHNKSRKDFVNVVAEFRPSEKQTINTYLGYTKSYDERYGELTVTQWLNNDYSGNTEYIRRDAHIGVRSVRAGIGHTYKLSKNISNTTSLFGTGFFSDASSAGGWTDRNFVNYGLRSTVDANFKLGEKVKLSGITGIETQGQRGQTLGYSMRRSPFDPTPANDNSWNPSLPYYVINTATSNFLITTGTTSLFTEWTLSLPSDFSITTGIGSSNQKINLNDRFNTPSVVRPNIYDTTYSNMVSPRIAINKVFHKSVSVYASYSRGYKPPVSSYFFITVPTAPVSSRVNNFLRPEIGSQFEIGSKGQLFKNRLSYEAAVFRTLFDNKMTSVSNTVNGTTLYRYVINGGSQIHKGLELLVRGVAFESDKGFFRSVRPFVNATFNDFKYSRFSFDSSNGKRVVFDGKKVAGAPDFIFNAGVDVEMQYGLYANVNFNHRDKMPITADNLIFAPAYNLLNGKIGIRRSISRHFDMDAYVGVINITNTKYYLMAFVNQQPDAYLPAPRYANVFGGVNVRYNF